MTIRGLLDVTDEERAEWRRQREQERKAAEAAAQREAKLQVELDQIDDAYSHALRNEIKAESEALKISSKQKLDFAKFQEWSRTRDFPGLPAPPQIVAAYLAEQLEVDADIVRLARSIGRVHSSVGFNDPTQDILVRALLRLARSEKNNSPQTKKDN